MLFAVLVRDEHDDISRAVFGANTNSSTNILYGATSDCSAVQGMSMSTSQLIPQLFAAHVDDNRNCNNGCDNSVLVVQ